MDTLDLLQELKITISPVLYDIINTLEPRIAESVEIYRRMLLEDEYPPLPRFMDFYLKNYRLKLISDLSKVSDKYFRKDDEIEIREVRKQHGTFSIYSTIKREGESYYFNTQQIIAGGNIQCMHFRYLVDTKLTPSPSVQLERAIRNEINQRNAFHKLNLEIENFENRLFEANLKLEHYKEKSTHEQILEICNSHSWLDRSSSNKERPVYTNLKELQETSDKKYILEISERDFKSGKYEDTLKVEIYRMKECIKKSLKKKDKMKAKYELSKVSS